MIVCSSKSHRILFSFSWTGSVLWIHHLFVWSNLNFLRSSQWIIFSRPAVSSLYFQLLKSFSHQRLLMVFHWSLSEIKSPQVSRTLLSILAVLNSVVVWMVSTRPLISMSFSTFNYLLVTGPKTPITIGIIVTFMFHSFINSLARSRYLSFFSFYFNFAQGWTGTVKSTICQLLFFY